jgi:hypothetical protein
LFVYSFEFNEKLSLIRTKKMVPIFQLQIKDYGIEQWLFQSARFINITKSYSNTTSSTNGTVNI